MLSPRYRQEISALLRLAWPIMGAQILTLGMVFTDNVMVAHLGEKPLAALAISGTVWSTLFILEMGMLSAMSPAISHAFGSGNDGEIGRWVRQGIRYSLVLSGCSMLMLLAARPLLIALGQSPELAAISQIYLRAMAWGVPGQFLYFCGRQLCEGTSDSRPSIFIVGAGALLNLFLNWVFIYGHLGFPAMGIAGSGYGTSVVSWLMAAAMGAYLLQSPRYRVYGIFKGAPFWNSGLIKKFMHVGIPISGGMLAEMCFFAGATLAMGTLGSHQLAGHQIALNAASFTFMIPLGLGFAVSIRVGQFRGRGDAAGVIVAGRSGFLVTIAMECVCAFIFLVFPEGITSIYTRDPQLASLGVKLLRIAGLFQLFDGLQVVGIYALRGLHDTTVPFLSTVVSFWIVAAPITWALMKHFGPPGVWYGMVLGLGLAAALHLNRFQRLTARLVQ